MRQKYKYTIKILIVTFITILLSRLVIFIPLSFKAFSSANSNDVSQFDIYTDLIYRSGVLPFDDKVVVVTLPNNSGRAELAKALFMLSECKPAGISIDVNLIGNSDDPETDDILKDALSMNDNVVLPCFIDKLQDTAKFFIKGSECGVTRGFVNLDNGGVENSIIRTFLPYYVSGNDTILSLPMQAIKIAFPEKIKELHARGNEHEYINYMRDIQCIPYTDVPSAEESITGRMVILGVDTQSDTHSSSINQRIVGLMLHAYAASTVMHHDYIDTPHPLLSDIIAFLIILLFTHCNFYYQSHFKHISGFLIRTTTYVCFFALLILGFVVFAEYSLYVESAWFLLGIAFTPWSIDIYNLSTTTINSINNQILKYKLKHKKT